MSKLNWNRLAAFAAGTFLGGAVLGFFSKLVARVGGK
jgi:hypothetical protein